VDVLGIVKLPGSSTAAKLMVVVEELPEEPMRAARAVAIDMNLPEDWLNDSALDVQRLGLPLGIRTLFDDFLYRSSGSGRVETLRSIGRAERSTAFERPARN